MLRSRADEFDAALAHEVRDGRLASTFDWKRRTLQFRAFPASEELEHRRLRDGRCHRVKLSPRLTSVLNACADVTFRVERGEQRDRAAPLPRLYVWHSVRERSCRSGRCSTTRRAMNCLG